MNFAACSGLSCPSDITQSNDPGQCGAVVTYSAGGAGDDCGTVSCSVPSGSFFPVGTTPVTCSSTSGPSCNFNVTVNDTEKPTVTPPANITVGNTPGQCSASVDPGTATAGDNCPGPTVSGVRSDGQPLNASYPAGTTTITWTATDTHGNSSAPANQTVTVKDAQPPSVTNVSASPALLRPPNHKMRNVTINYIATDNCSAVTCTLSVKTNDSDDHDYRIVDAHHVLLEPNGIPRTATAFTPSRLPAATAPGTKLLGRPGSKCPSKAALARLVRQSFSTKQCLAIADGCRLLAFCA